LPDCMHVFDCLCLCLCSDTVCCTKCI